jgi:hypothetical protein
MPLGEGRGDQQHKSREKRRKSDAHDRIASPRSRPAWSQGCEAAAGASTAWAILSASMP